jgi:alkylation response protein AidB-like acyl-CoA dehydrogenase
MDITLNEQQALIAETALSFARNALAPQAIRDLESDETGFDRGTWQKMVEMGWAGAVFPAEYGGAGLTLLELSLIVEALGQGAVPSPLFSTVVEAGMLILEAGSPAQRSHWLPRIADGRTILTAAIVEPGGGLLPGEIRTVVARDGTGYRVSGTKLFVRDAGVAEVILCVGREGDGAAGMTLVAVPADAPGVARRRLRAAGGESLWEVTFDGVEVGDDAALGLPGRAWPHIERLLLRGAALKAAELVGTGQAAMDLTVAYAKSRIQFGRPIGSFQAVQRHCADMYRDVAVSRLHAWQAATRLSEGRPALREVAMAKAKSSDVIPAVTRTAHQVHGAFGFYRDYPLELYYHRAIAAAATFGDARHHRRCLALLLREDMDGFRGDHRHAMPVQHL